MNIKAHSLGIISAKLCLSLGVKKEVGQSLRPQILIHIFCIFQLLEYVISFKFGGKLTLWEWSK